MQIVIDVPDNETLIGWYTHFDGVNQYHNAKTLGEPNYILLPKGHGKIGDLDALREEVSSWGMNDYEPSDFIDEIDRAETIIEADRSET